MDKALKQMTKPLEVKNHTEKHKQEKSALLKTPKELKIVYVEESKVKDVTNILEESMQKKGMQKESDTLNSSPSHSQHTLSCTSDSLHRNIVDEDNNDKCFGAKGQISLKWDTASFNEQESEPVKDRKLINQWKVQESQNKYLEDSHFSSTEMKGQAQIKDEILEENIIDDHYQSIPNIQGCLDVIKKENEVTLNVDHESLIKTLEKTNLQKVKSEASEIIFPVDQGEMVIEKLESEEVVGEDRDIIPTAIGDENVKKNYSKVNFTMQKSHENHLEVGGNFKELQNITCLGYLDTLKHEKLDSDKDAVVVKNEMMSVVPQINDADFITEPSDEPNLNLKWTNYVAQSLNSFAHRGTPTNTEQEVKAVGQKEKCRKNSDVTDNSMLVKPLNSLTETSKVSQSVPSNEHRLTESEEIKYQDLESDIKLNAKDTEETQMTQEEKIEQEIERKNRSLDKNNYNSRVLDEEDFKNSEREGSANIQRTAGRLLRKNVKYTEKMKEFMSFVKQEVEEMTAGSASTTSHFKTLSPGGLLKGQARTPVSTGTERKYSAILADTNSKATPRMEENDEFPKLENLENVSYKIPFQYGWKREIVFRAVVEGKLQNKKGRMADIYYFSPTGQKLRSLKDVQSFMDKHPSFCLPLECFIFSKYSVYHEPLEIHRFASIKYKTLETISPTSTPTKRKKVSSSVIPETKMPVPTATETQKKDLDGIVTPKIEKKYAPKTKPTPNETGTGEKQLNITITHKRKKKCVPKIKPAPKGTGTPKEQLNSIITPEREKKCVPKIEPTVTTTVTTKRSFDNIVSKEESTHCPKTKYRAIERSPEKKILKGVIMPKEEKRCGPRIKYTSVVPRDTSIKLSDSILKPKRETKCGPKIKFTPIRLKEGKSSPQIQYFLQSVIKIPKICIRKLDSEDSVQAEDKQISASKDVQDEDMMQISANKSTWGEAAKVNGNKSIQDEDMMQISANKSTWDEDMMQISANKSTWDEDMMQISANKSMWDEDMMQISANKSIRDEAVKEVSVYKSIQDEAKKQVSANKSLQEEMKKQINANKVKKSKSRKKIILEKNERVKLKKKKKKQTFEAAKEVSVYKSIQDKAKKQVSANKNLQEEMKKQTNANKVKKPKSRKKIISEKNKRVKRKKKKKKQTFSLLSKIKAGSSKAILCSLHCVDRNFELPSLHCGICLCLFHPECVGIPPSSHPSTFICQFCRKNVKRKVLLLPPGVCPLMPQEFHILNQTNPLYNGRAEEETLMPAETNIRPNTTIPPVPEVVLTKEPSVKEGSIGNNTPKASGPLKTSLAAISNLEHQTISPFPSAPLRHNLSQTQNLISRNSLGGDNMGQISNASSASSSNEVPNSVVQNMLYSPVNTQTSFCRPASSPVSQSPSHVIGSVSGAVVTSLPLSSSSTPHLLQALSTPPLSRAGNGPIAHAGKSQPIQRTHKNLLLPAYRTVANTPLLPDGFLATSPAGRPATEISNSSLPICSASSELQPVTNLVMCSSGSNICLTSTMPVVSSLDTAVLPQVLTVRPFVCSTFPFASNSSTFKVKIQKSNPFQAYNVVLSERMCGSNIKTTGTTSTTVTDNVSFTVSESVAVEKKTISSHTKEVSQATIPFVSSQIETISPLPKEESMVLESETSSVQTEFDKQSVQSEIELKEVKVTLVKLPEVMFNYSVKSQASKENLKIQIPNPLLCHINRLVGGFDCINDIFQYLGVMDLLRASQVSRSWKNIARQSNLWKSVCLKGLHITSWARCAKALEQFHTTSLDLRDVKHREDHVTFWHSFIQCLEHLKNIRYLTFGVVVPEVLPAVFGTIIQLQTLRAECVTEAIEPSVWIMLCKIDFIKMGRLTNLNSLWIRGGGGLQLSPLLSSGSLWCLGNLTLLRHLHLTTLVGAPSESFQFLEKLLLLESLAIGDCYSWNSWNYSCLGKLKHLKKLRLEKGGQLNDPSLQNALSNLTCLEELQLLCFVIPSNLGSALEKLQNLSQLVIWPDIYKQAPRVNQNTIEAVSSLKTLHKFSWGVMSLPSEMNNEDNTFDKQKMISFLRHKENCQCSCNKNSSKTQINPECIVRVHLEEFEQQLRNLFTNTRITVYSVPMESFNRFCSSFR